MVAHDLAQALVDVLLGPERTVIALYYHEGLTMKEIGRVMGISESRVCQIHTKTLKKLKVHLDELGGATRAPAARREPRTGTASPPGRRPGGRERSARPRRVSCGAPAMLGAPRRMDHFHHRDGRLFCEGVPLDAIADAVGTPAYVYSAAHHPRPRRSGCARRSPRSTR